MIVCDHIARYYIMDKQYNKLFKDDFSLIQWEEGNTLIAYPEIYYKKFQTFVIDKQGNISKGAYNN
jgi:hypothetical protein